MKRGLASLLLALLALLLITPSCCAENEQIGSYTPMETPSPSAQQVTVGFYPVKVYQLDMTASSYYLDAFVWFDWTGPLDPLSSLKFTDLVEQWSRQMAPLFPERQVFADESM